MKVDPIIVDDGLISIEPVSLNALDDFHEYSMKQDLYKYLEFDSFRSIDETRSYLKKLIKRSDSECAQYWCIRLLEENKVIGTIGLHSLDTFRKSIEIGYGISPDYWGRGIFTRSGFIILEYVFNTLKLHRIVAKTAAENIASIRGLEKLGFQIEGTLRDYYCFSDGIWHDAVFMSLLSTD